MHDGTAGPWMALELAAQGAGLFEAVRQQAAADGSPRVGYLVRVRSARFAVPHLAADAPLLARVELEGGSGPLSRWTVTSNADATPPSPAPSSAPSCLPL